MRSVGLAPAATSPAFRQQPVSLRELRLGRRLRLRLVRLRRLRPRPERAQTPSFPCGPRGRVTFQFQP